MNAKLRSAFFLRAFCFSNYIALCFKKVSRLFKVQTNDMCISALIKIFLKSKTSQ